MKNTLKAVFGLMAILSVSLVSVAYAAPDATIQSDDNAINTACSSDAQTASCGSDVVGKGLLRCLHAYKKSNPSFKFSASCKAAMKQRRSDKKAGK